MHEEEFLRKWLKEKPASSRAPYAYRIDKLQRLALPDSPGVYRMLAKTGKILYVGKATSLKDRVNSYFRGRKGRDQRKLEMLAQVWDLRVTPCRTPLEAALLESDEIKRHDPPYNVALKTNDRRLLFYDRDFASTSHEFGDRHRLGPFRESNWIERLRLIVSSLEQNSFDQIFYFEIPPEDLHAGFELFCRTQGVDLDQLRTIRSLLALGMRQPPIIKCDAEDESENVDPITIEEIAAKFGRLLRRAADELLRARQMTRLLNCKIECGENRLEFRGGQIWKNGALADEKNGDWRGLGVETFDRLSIVLSELSRQPHRIECIKDRGQPGMSSIRAPSKADNNPLSP